MDNNIRKKNIILSVVVVLVGILLAGGTYAYLTFSINVTNNVVNANTTCFDIDYLDTNQITGTLFPSAGPKKGINGKVTMKVKSTCDLDGVGKLYIHVNSGTSTKFTTRVAAHCESPYTLETLKEYTSSDDCTNHGIWVTDGTPLKYAVYESIDGVYSPNSVGYVNEIGTDISVYNAFDVTHKQKDYYLFFWLDGALTDNTYTNLMFDGYIKAEAIQARTIYTANVSASNTKIGLPIPSEITQYKTPEEAMTALKAAGDGTTNYPFFFRHIVANEVGGNYLGFVVTPEMAAANSGMTVGTYYLKAQDYGFSYNENKAVLQSAFGQNTNYCSTLGENTIFKCSVGDFTIFSVYVGTVFARIDNNMECSISQLDGASCKLL